MTRALFELVVQDEEGDVQPNRAVSVFETDGTTPFGQTMYSAATGGSVVISPQTNSLGMLKLYADLGQRVTFTISGTSGVHDGAFYVDPGDIVLESDVVTETGTQAIVASSPTVPTLTLTQSNALGPVLRLVDGTASTVLESGQSGTFLPTAPLFVGTPSAVAGISLGVYKEAAPGSGPWIPFDVGMTIATTGEDHGVTRAVARQNTTGNSAFRAGEFHVLRNSGDGSLPTWGIELGCHSKIASSGPNVGKLNLGIYIYGDNTLWHGSGPNVVQDDAILIGGANGWKNAWRFFHTDSSTVLARVAGGSLSGDLPGDIMSAGRVYSTGNGGTRVGLLNHASAPSGQTWFGLFYDDTQQAGTLGAVTTGTGYRPLLLSPGGGGVGVGRSTTPLAATLDVNGTIAGSAVYAAAGSALSPSHSITGDTDTGLYGISGDNLGLATGGVLRTFIDNGGSFVHGTGALNTTATTGHLYIPGGAGAPTGVPTSYTGRNALYVDTTNNRIYVRIGASWRYAALT